MISQSLFAQALWINVHIIGLKGESYQAHSRKSDKLNLSFMEKKDFISVDIHCFVVQKFTVHILEFKN
jgi:hypothetical protein